MSTCQPRQELIYITPSNVNPKNIVINLQVWGSILSSNMEVLLENIFRLSTKLRCSAKKVMPYRQHCLCLGWERFLSSLSFFLQNSPSTCSFCYKVFFIALLHMIVVILLRYVDYRVRQKCLQIDY